MLAYSYIKKAALLYSEQVSLFLKSKREGFVDLNSKGHNLVNPQLLYPIIIQLCPLPWQAVPPGN